MPDPKIMNLLNLIDFKIIKSSYSSVIKTWYSKLSLLVQLLLPPDFCKRSIVNCWLLLLVKPTPENELFAVFWIGWGRFYQWGWRQL